MAEIMDDDDEDEGALTGEPATGASPQDSALSQHTNEPSFDDSPASSSHPEKSKPRDA